MKIQRRVLGVCLMVFSAAVLSTAWLAVSLYPVACYMGIMPDCVIDFFSCMPRDVHNGLSSAVFFVVASTLVCGAWLTPNANHNEGGE